MDLNSLAAGFGLACALASFWVAYAERYTGTRRKRKPVAVRKMRQVRRTSKSLQRTIAGSPRRVPNRRTGK